MINRFPFPCGGGSIIPPVNSASDIVETFDYCGNAIYEDKVLTTLLFDGGYVSYTKSGTGIHATYTPTYHFYMKDHLGSNRVVASVTGEAGLKGRKGTNALYYYGMREATNHPFVCPVCLLSSFGVCLSN